MIKKGQLVWVDLDGKGSEQRGFRPCIVVQNNQGNRFSPTTIVVPMTTNNPKRKLLPTHLIIKAEILGGDFKDSVVLTEQIKIVDKSRIKRSCLVLPKEVINEIDRKMIISLGIKKTS